MTRLDIARRRLAAQHLAQQVFTTAAEVVRWLGAVQAQDYPGARWAVGQRARGLDDAAVERAFDEGAILRTHVLRPTWHFVTPADIRWMLALTAPRIRAVSAYYYRKVGLDDAVLRRSHAALAKALQGGKQLTRAELARVLERAGVDTKGPLRMGYLLMRAELDGVVCSGARRGKQLTYALLQERAPQVVARDRDDALSELTRRYFTTRGPATWQDFAWWSGLSVADAKRGTGIVGGELQQATFDGQTYWSAEPSLPAQDASLPAKSASLPAKSGSTPARNASTPAKDASRTAHLLPNYDEYFIGFKDRSAIGEAVKEVKLMDRTSALSAHIMILDGQIVGGWKRALKSDAVVVETTFLTLATKTDRRAIAAAAAKYGAFLGLPVVLEDG